MKRLARDWELMGKGERAFHVAGLLLTAACFVVLVGIFAVHRLGDNGYSTAILWWLLVAAQSCRVAGALSGKGRKAAGAFRTDVIVSLVVAALFVLIALRSSHVL